MTLRRLANKALCALAGVAFAASVACNIYGSDAMADAKDQPPQPHLPPASTVLPIQRGANGQLELFDPTKKEGTGQRRCSAGSICVGTDQAFPTLSAALAVARDGDVIEIIAETYHESVRIAANNVTLRGVLGRPHFDCAALRLSGDKACLLLAGNNITLENLEISGAVIAEELGANGACIRNEPNKSFSLKRILCHGSQDGVLSDGGNILIENSEFFDNGWTDRTHNIYLSGNCTVTVRGSIFRDARVGHEFKSRCIEADISDSTFRSTKGSRNLDLSDGGEVVLYRSTLVKTPGADNDEIIGFAPESCAHPGDLVLKQVHIINSQPAATIRNYDKCVGHTIILEGLTVEGIAPKLVGFIKSTAAAR